MENTTNSQLKDRDYVLILDKSGSMAMQDTPSGKSRWDYMQESITGVANKIATFDQDGFTIISYSGNYKTYENSKPEKVKDIFAEYEPMGGSTLAPVLSWVFKNYLERKESGKTKKNGELLLIIANSEPTDKEQVAKEIADFTQKLESGNEYGIQFFQVGKDSSVSQFLKYLSDNVQPVLNAKWNIVTTKTMEELEVTGLEPALIAAIG